MPLAADGAANQFARAEEHFDGLPIRPCGNVVAWQRS
jgi:hypothetical protein